MSDQYIPWWIADDHPARDPEGRAKALADAREAEIAKVRADAAEDVRKAEQRAAEAERKLADALKPSTPPMVAVPPPNPAIALATTNPTVKP